MKKKMTPSGLPTGLCTAPSLCLSSLPTSSSSGSRSTGSSRSVDQGHICGSLKVKCSFCLWVQSYSVQCVYVHYLYVRATQGKLYHRNDIMNGQSLVKIIQNIQKLCTEMYHKM